MDRKDYNKDYYKKNKGKKSKGKKSKGKPEKKSKGSKSAKKKSKGEKNKGCGGMEEKYQANAEFRPNHKEKAEQGDSGKPHGRYTKVKNKNS